MKTAEIQSIVRDDREQLATNKLNNLEEMDKFLELYNLPRLNHEEMKNPNRSITSEIETVIKTFPKTKFQDQTASLGNSTKHSKST